ncbi:IclR family transcriptional regulator [Brevibacillus sp. B_LB10_24]|uniref:IclR family transcriptional regulator n=1 Tax=Brevibacillus sp. B_LB10_24 TaxID=3380645 RepID=UPI0038B725E5
MTKQASKPNVISKTLEVIRAFTDHQKEWGVNELARFLDVPVSTLHRILKILRGENILEVSSETGKYKIGAEMIRMSSIISSKVDIKNVARPFMKKLSNMVNESVYLALYHPQHKKMSLIDSVHSSNNALQYVLELGVLQPIYFAASGKVILAFLGQEEIDSVFQAEGVSEEDQVKIRKEIAMIREQAYAFTINERKIGALGISAPIFDASQKVIGSLFCVVPVKNFDESKKDFFVRHVKEEAKNISNLLGFR